MTTKLVAVCLLAAATTVAGCATVTRGSSDTVNFTSVPEGVKVTTSLGTSCVTPCEMTKKRRAAFTATFEHQQQQRIVNVKPVTSGEGVAAGAGNVLAGGIIGIAVDAGTGANLDHFPNPVHANFNTPANQAQAVAEQHAREIKKAQAAAAAAEQGEAKETPRY